MEERAKLNKLVDDRNAAISHSEAEIVKRNVIIERKQSQIDQINKKIDKILTDRGGVRSTSSLN